MQRTIRVFIVDDSAVVRTTISLLLRNERDIAVAGTAADPLIAERKFAREGWPDVIILDIEMPKMDGLTFLRKIMDERPTPVVICSSLVQNGSRSAVEALSSGAVELIAKPEAEVKSFLHDSKAWLVHAIKAAAAAQQNVVKKPVTPKSVPVPGRIAERFDTDAVLRLKTNRTQLSAPLLVAIGASTGGVQVLEKILSSLPEKCPPVLIVQHMPPGFTKSLAERLDRMSLIHVKEAESGDKLIQGRALIAPGDKHMMLKRTAKALSVEVKDGPRVSRHKPSIDVLFRSCANEAGPSVLGFLLTGMGDDGAKGLKEIREHGGRTYAQNEASCTVYGMPKVAMLTGASMAEMEPDEMIEIIKKGK